MNYYGRFSLYGIVKLFIVDIINTYQNIYHSFKKRYISEFVKKDIYYNI